MSTDTKSATGERRRAARVPLRVHVRYESLDEFLDDYTSNVSIGGMFIARAMPLDLGTRFRLQFSVPGRSTPVITMATVRWVVRPGEGMTAGMGVAFDPLPKADELRVQRWLHKANLR